MKFTLHITILIFLSSCAHIVAPSGGVKDSESPKLLSSRFEFNENSAEKNVIFEFDEKIQEHIFVGNFYCSPPLKEVSYKIIGKYLYITIRDNFSRDLKYIMSS